MSAKEKNKMRQGRGILDTPRGATDGIIITKNGVIKARRIKDGKKKV